jgi:glycosyltransferase involved in cell wall biosynthesis
MLAIVIPYFKLTFFEETLKSLANQTDKRFKVYISNDASPENPLILLEKFGGTFDFVYHNFGNNMGSISLVKQWDRCINLTEKEEWIMILGDDDYLGDNVVEQFYFNFNSFKSKTNVVRFASQTVYEMEKIKSKIFTNPVWEKETDSYFRKYKGLSRSSLSEHVFFKETYLNYGFKDYPLGWHSDDKAWLDFSEDKMIYSINESVVYIRISDSSISGKSDNKDLKYIAKIHFMKDVILNNLKSFTINQRLELLLDYESKLKWKEKLTYEQWFWLFQFYLKNFRTIPFLKYIRRFLKATVNL